MLAQPRSRARQSSIGTSLRAITRAARPPTIERNSTATTVARLETRNRRTRRPSFDDGDGPRLLSFFFRRSPSTVNFVRRHVELGSAGPGPDVRRWLPSFAAPDEPRGLPYEYLPIGVPCVSPGVRHEVGEGPPAIQLVVPVGHGDAIQCCFVDPGLE